MKKRWLIIIPVVVLLSFLLLIAVKFPGLVWLELKSIDWRFNQRKPIEVTGDIVVVSIDEKSLHREGRWPWPRDKVARLIERINEAGAAIIEVDIIFAEPTLSDQVLVKTLDEKKNIILGYFFYQSEQELEGAEIEPEIMERSFKSILPTAFPDISGLKELLPEMVGVISNTRILTQAALSQGYFNAFPDPDGVIRRFSLMVTYRDKIFPSMALETFSQHMHGFDPVPVRDREGHLEGVSLGTRYIPTNKQGQLLINYRGAQGMIPIYSATDVLEGNITAEQLANKTVLIGATAVGIYDLRVTPMSPNFPGVLVQAQLLDNLYRGDFLVENVWTQFCSVAVIVLMTLLLGLALPRIRIVTGLVVTAVLIVAYVLFVQWMFARGFVLALVAPSFAAFTLYMVLTIYRALTEEREKRTIRSAFQAYLHPDLVKELTEDISKLKLGGQETECTILFVDVRNFTAMSEEMNPERVVELMNYYFDPIAKEIIEDGGYVDKFIGDAVMAIFGVPKTTPGHALQACRAAITMQKMVEQMAPFIKSNYGIDDFHVGVGVHSGKVVVGNIGTRNRLNYTVMGDAVNIAARLEEATKILLTPICISEATYEQAGDGIEARFIDEISVRGKAQKVRVYELMGEKK